jgi:hypothetical protein
VASNVLLVGDFEAHSDRNRVGLTFRYGLSASDHDVHHELLDLAGVGVDCGQVFREVEMQSNRARYGGLNQRNHFPDPGGHVYPFQNKAALTGIGKHLPDEWGGSLAVGNHGLDCTPGLAIRRDVIERQTRITQNAPPRDY